MGVEAYHMLYHGANAAWNDASLCGANSALRCKQHAMQLTHADWLATPHRDPSDITPLRQLKTRPGRSMYLYREEHRDTAILRARLRLNRASYSHQPGSR